MNKPFEAPKNETPKEEVESVDVNVSDLSGDPVHKFGSGLHDIDPAQIAANHAALGNEFAGERATAAAILEKIASGFFQENPFLKARFDKDPEAMRRFKGGLMQIISMGERKYQLDPAELPGDARFQKDMVKYSFDFEEEELKRSAGRRAA